MSESNAVQATAPQGQLAEIWGDVVSRPQLGKAMMIGAVMSVVVYFAGLQMTTPLAATPAVGKALAMLAGIIGSVASGAVCARIFPPKRVVTEHIADASAWQVEVLEQLEQEGGPIGRLSDLPPVAAEEMRQIGLYEVFQNYEQGRSTGHKGE
ncbi:cell division protein FtsW (lipid II flippase) [Agrobacterium tumefaciens]|uniref:Cell division protein FtsW (Lipid II flippase) n=1 Tax=Agrobacterium radiobacter TaxID=362 RepID=A0ABR6JFB5_AGRRD|nr:hypothetical protein [Agrobacterium radiobacter]MBB4321258.1 cell division protein FtsW (lipid II flippase) [Agrobacterium radiobacter]MBB4338298.1 cell division protein FtsW (lipid II flippase) [Agrobacterium radiobacter]MBB4493186.1 cell division protein FtsW (lipid II flippase) [Agrobacterium radiobacter]MBB4498459.1 cell division protein FtsW (lipid II flippase) [Agrobacterium radiobacter]MBB4503842.1 cell division protein FtsW (lipid II flippase) [Agrobacterium radiobacter]